MKYTFLTFLCTSLALMLSCKDNSNSFYGTFLYHGTVHWGAFVFDNSGQAKYVFAYTKDDNSVGRDSIIGNYEKAGDTATLHIMGKDSEGLDAIDNVKAVVHDNTLFLIDYPMCPCERGSIPLRNE